MTISIHPPHAGRDERGDRGQHAVRNISIHPPHAGRDTNGILLSATEEISIHPPHAGRDCLAAVASRRQARLFQSTRPMRGGTLAFHDVPSL